MALGLLNQLQLCNIAIYTDDTTLYSNDLIIYFVILICIRYNLSSPLPTEDLLQFI